MVVVFVHSPPKRLNGIVGFDLDVNQYGLDRTIRAALQERNAHEQIDGAFLTGGRIGDQFLLQPDRGGEIELLDKIGEEQLEEFAQELPQKQFEPFVVSHWHPPVSVVHAPGQVLQRRHRSFSRARS